MGLFDKIKGLFSNKEADARGPWNAYESEAEKEILANKVLNLIDKISRINSFDRSINGLLNISPYIIKSKSLDELRSLENKLETRLGELTKGNSRANAQRESLNEAMWTGRSNGLSSHDLNRSQCRDDWSR